MPPKTCNCCKHEIEIVIGSTKYCKNCSFFISNLRIENNNLKNIIKRLRKTISNLRSMPTNQS